MRIKYFLLSSATLLIIYISYFFLQIEQIDYTSSNGKSVIIIDNKPPFLPLIIFHERFSNTKYMTRIELISDLNYQFAVDVSDLNSHHELLPDELLPNEYILPASLFVSSDIIIQSGQHK